MLRSMRTLMIAFAGLAAGIGMPRLDETQPPPLRIELQIDGKSHQLVEGQKASIQIGDQKHEVLARSMPTRTFHAAGLAFDYAAGMSFEYENDEELGMRLWTLTGNDTVVMVYEFDEGSANGMAREILQATVDELADGKTEAIELRVGGKAQKAYKAAVSFDGEPMTFFTFGARAGDRCCVVMVQDSSGEADTLAAETRQMMQRIDKTFRITKQ